MAKPVIFLSHATSEAAVAQVLKVAIQQGFLRIAEVFVSSDPGSIAPGKRWLTMITNNLKSATAMLVLASPESVGRPWLNFEAGAAWIRTIDVIPLCHSGMTPATLPMPLREFQGLRLGDEADLRKMFESLAKLLDCDMPSVNIPALAANLATAIADLPVPTRDRVPPVLLDRNLSEEREALEGVAHQRILRMQSLRTAGATASDAAKMSQLIADAERFLVDPTSFQPDKPLRRLLDRLGEVTADLAADLDLKKATAGAGLKLGSSDPDDIKQGVLKALRELGRKQARTNEILSLDLDEVALSLGNSRDAIEDALVDLLAEGKAVGYAETFTDRKEDGHCRITPIGMAAIRD